jgi:hypothetical protein
MVVIDFCSLFICFNRFFVCFGKIVVDTVVDLLWFYFLVFLFERLKSCFYAIIE